MTDAAEVKTESALLELAARVEAATGPDRELDGELDRLLHDRPANKDYDEAENCLWQVDGVSGLCVRYDGFARKSFSAASYTASLDAALTLVPEGCLFITRTLWEGDKRTAIATVSRYEQSEFGGHPRRYWMDEHQADASTPALALCAASLRARASLPPSTETRGEK